MNFENCFKFAVSVCFVVAGFQNCSNHTNFGAATTDNNDLQMQNLTRDSETLQGDSEIPPSIQPEILPSIKQLPSPFILARTALENKIYYSGGVISDSPELDAYRSDSPDYRNTPLAFAARVRWFREAITTKCVPVKLSLGDLDTLADPSLKYPRQIKYKAYLKLGSDNYANGIYAGPQKFQIPSDIVGFSNELDRPQFSADDLESSGITIFQSAGASRSAYSVVVEAEIEKKAINKYLDGLSEFDRRRSGLSYTENTGEFVSVRHMEQWILPFSVHQSDESLCDLSNSGASHLQNVNLLIAWESEISEPMKRKIIYRSSDNRTVVIRLK